MLKSGRNALSLEQLTNHQQRIRRMVSRIQTYQPKFDQNKLYQQSKRFLREKRIEEKQKKNNHIHEENQKILNRIETIAPKISISKFPEVSLNKKRAKTLSLNKKTLSLQKYATKDTFRHEEGLFQENVKLITNIECTGPKIQCWTSKKVRNLNELITVKKRQEQKKILEKFRQISQEINKLSKHTLTKRTSSKSSIIIGPESS